MANLGQKDGIFHVRSRYRGKEYKKSLKTREQGAAQAACYLVELTIRRLYTEQTQLPADIDAGDFIVSGGTLLKPSEPPVKQVAFLSSKALIEEYGKSQKALMAPSYHYSQTMHLRHLMRYLGERVDDPCDQITFRDLVLFEATAFRASRQHR